MIKMKTTLARLMWVASAAVMLSACASTDIIEEDAIKEKSEEITLFLSTPEKNGDTRADNDHVLRYTAKLFEGDYVKDGINFRERKEVLATSGDPTITFSVPVGTYTVVLFADYIPKDSQPDENGHYADRYYDTSSEKEDVSMRAFTDKLGTVKLPYNCINNDNYDCFSNYRVIAKTEEKYERDVTLQRAVSKIRFVSRTDAPSPVKGLTFSKFSYLRTLSLVGGIASDFAPYQQMGLGVLDPIAPSDIENNELFYFYTLAHIYGDATDQLKDLKFKIAFDDGSEREYEIGSGTIQFQRNYITTVKGPFLSDDLPDLGDIILHLSTSDDWKYPGITIE